MGVSRAPVTILAALTLALVVAVLAGCGGDQSASVAATGKEQVRELDSADGFTTYAVPSLGYEIAFPSEWLVARHLLALETVNEAIREFPPGFAEIVADVSLERQSFYAIDPDLSDEGVLHGINIGVVPLEPSEISDDLEESAEMMAEALEAILGIPVEAEVVTTPAGAAVRTEFELEHPEEGVRALFVQQDYVRQGKSYVITCHLRAEDADEHMPVFERSLASFRFTDGESEE